VVEWRRVLQQVHLASRIAFWIPAIVFGAALLAWPLSVTYLMFLGSGVSSGFVLHIKEYIGFSAALYPIFYLLAIALSRNALAEGAHWTKVLALGLIPMLNGLIWMLLLDLSMRFML